MLAPACETSLRASASAFFCSAWFLSAWLPVRDPRADWAAPVACRENVLVLVEYRVL